MKIQDLIAFAKAGYTPGQVKQIKEYTSSVENPADILEFVKAGWKPEDINELIMEQPEVKVEEVKTKDPLEELKNILTGGNDNAG